MSITEFITEPIMFNGVDVTAIVDVLFKFVQKILEVYLPTEVKDVITDIEEM